MVKIIIPARYKSTRFPGKPLALIKGTPMLVLVWKACCEFVGKNDVYIATDSDIIRDYCSKNGIQCIMTCECLTGTDRVFDCVNKLEGDLFLNVQGDEPLIKKCDIDKIYKELVKNSDLVYCGMSDLNVDDCCNINIPKVVTNEQNRLLYISRSAIPSTKTGQRTNIYKKQVCIYGFNRNNLNKFGKFGRKSVLESIEDIEILRFFETDVVIKMVEVSGSLSVDIPEDVEKVERYINSQNE